MAPREFNLLRNLDPVGGQIVDPIASSYAPNQPKNRAFRLMGEGVTAWEPRMKRPKVAAAFDGSEDSFFDFLKVGPVSTGLGLALDNPNSGLASSSGEARSSSGVLSPMGGVLEQELQKMGSEMDTFLRLQGDRMRKSIEEKLRAQQLQTLASFESKFLQEMQDKDLQIQAMTKSNNELEEQLRTLHREASMWQQQAKINEDKAVSLQSQFQQVYAAQIEGSGDSEVDSVSRWSKVGGDTIDFKLLHTASEAAAVAACKGCGVNEACVLVMPCRHLCLCRNCEAELVFCPVCCCPKDYSVEVYF